MGIRKKDLKLSILISLWLGPISLCLGADKDDPSFIQRNSWEGSFDKSADAARAAELELKKGVTLNCDSAQFQNAGLTPAQISQRVADCLKTQQEAQGYAKKTEGIRKTQRVLSDLSKVSDAAAVGAVGAAGYMELMHKDASQADNLRSVANIEEAAAYAAYATAATDFSMGAYAYLSHKQKLETMKEKLDGTTQNSAAVEKLNAAAEATTQAAYNHMLYGVGKAAVGYTGMWLAKNNREEAERLSSINTGSIEAAPALTVGALPNNGPVFTQNNGPTITYPGGSSNGDGSGVAAVYNSNPVASTSGASVAPSYSSRKLASTKAANAGGGGNNNSLLNANAAGAAGGETSNKEEEKGEPAKEALQSFEVSLSGGGPSYRGNAGKTEGPSIPQLLNSLLGMEEPSKSAATGLNPNQMYREALASREEQSSADGIHESSDSSLFELIKAKHNKMLESGRLQGPGPVSER